MDALPNNGIFNMPRVDHLGGKCGSFCGILQLLSEAGTGTKTTQKDASFKYWVY